MSNKFLLTAVAVLVFGLSIQGYSQSNIPTIHQPFPDIELPTLDGGKTSLSDLLGEKNVVLVTYRGWVGFWWPLCRRQLGELNSAYKRFADQDTELVFISPDNREDTGKFLKEIDLGEKRNFTMMLDPDFNVIKKLLLFKENDVKGEALPATFIIDNSR